MKKILVFCMIFALVFITLFSYEASARKKDNLYEKFSKRGVVKTYVAPISEPAIETNPDVKNLRKVLEDQLTVRMSINFDIVDSADEADIIIDCEILEYFWTEEDPIDTWGWAAMAIDAAKKENYSRMEAVFTVTDAKKGKVILERKIRGMITDDSMSEEESVSMINERIVKIFIIKCFGKPRKRSML